MLTAPFDLAAAPRHDPAAPVTDRRLLVERAFESATVSSGEPPRTLAEQG
jgi:hypothetical protein